MIAGDGEVGAHLWLMRLATRRRVTLPQSAARWRSRDVRSERGSKAGVARDAKGKMVVAAGMNARPIARVEEAGRRRCSTRCRDLSMPRPSVPAAAPLACPYVRHE